MLKGGLVFSLVFAVASVANAGVFIDLAPGDPGPYVVGAGPWTFDVSVSYINEEAFDIEVRLIQFDTVLSDPIINGTEFAFDFSDVAGGAMYAVFPAYDLPGAAYLGTAPIPGLIKVIPADFGTNHVGDINVTIPDVLGTYLLDVMNEGDPDPNRGAILQFDFDNPVTWTAGDGLSGGVLVFEVIPEPASLALLGLGMLAALRRRR